MTKVEKCPICERGELKIFLLSGYDICFNGKLSELLNKVYCTNCKRTIKYKLVKKDIK